MHMGMPAMGGMGHHGGAHHGHHRMPPFAIMMVVMFHSLFWMAATVCFLGALNRGANALKLESRVKALKAFPEAFTEDEQMILIEKITMRAVGPF